MLLLAGRSEIRVGVNSTSVQSVQQHDAQCSGATSRCVLRLGMTDRETGAKQGAGGLGGDMAVIADCVVGLLKCDGSNEKLMRQYQSAFWVCLLATTAISNYVLGLLISYDSDIKLRFGFTY
jgi:hypothetical protein